MSKHSMRASWPASTSSPSVLRRAPQAARLPGQRTAMCGDGQAGVLLGHLDPDPLHGQARLADLDRPSGHFAEPIGDLVIGERQIDENPRWNRMHEIMLIEKGQQRLGGDESAALAGNCGRSPDAGRREPSPGSRRAVRPRPPKRRCPHHPLVALDVLFLLHLAQRLDLVTIDGSLLESELFAAWSMAADRLPMTSCCRPCRKRVAICHILRIAFRLDQADAGARAALDLVQQARP
jgi:hypothetical protein